MLKQIYCFFLRQSLMWWFIPIILALGRQKQEDCCKLEFKVSLDYSVQLISRPKTSKPSYNG